jgi:thymidylate synthase ThyX
VNILDHGYVNLVETWGSDERIIEAARMSTDGAFRGWDHDLKLLSYLWKHKHHTPFEMCGLTLEVQAPLFVVREWERHRTQSYNELSGRYTELPDLYYIPSVKRLMNGRQSQVNRQGSEGVSMPTLLSTCDLVLSRARSTLGSGMKLCWQAAFPENSRVWWFLLISLLVLGLRRTYAIGLGFYLSGLLLTLSGRFSSMPKVSHHS